MRVGTGGKLDGLLTPAVRNYILSNTAPVFERSYQPVHLRRELMSLIFGDNLAGTHEALFDKLRQSTFKRDENAPIYPTQEDVQEIEQHDSMLVLCAKSSKSSPGEREQIRQQMRYLRAQLSAQKVQERRNAYFKMVDKRRALGLPTDDLAVQCLSTHRHLDDPIAAANIGQLLRQSCELQANRNESEERQRFVDSLLSYLVATPKPTLEVESTPNPFVGKGTPGKPRCLLCDREFSRRDGLTKHHRQHLSDGRFSEPFPCPECVRLQWRWVIIEGPQHWSSHAEQTHGRATAPNLPRRWLERKLDADQLGRRTEERPKTLNVSWRPEVVESTHDKSTHDNATAPDPLKGRPKRKLDVDQPGRQSEAKRPKREEDNDDKEDDEEGPVVEEEEMPLPSLSSPSSSLPSSPPPPSPISSSIASTSVRPSWCDAPQPASDHGESEDEVDLL